VGEREEVERSAAKVRKREARGLLCVLSSP
jgi:hypothetical protein